VLYKTYVEKHKEKGVVKYSRTDADVNPRIRVWRYSGHGTNRVPASHQNIVPFN